MPELFLTIPCTPGKSGDHLKGPIYIYDGKNSMEAYKCPYCGQTGPRREPIEKHMGLQMNNPASCKVLKAQDAKRRERPKEDVNYGNTKTTAGTSEPVGTK